MDDLRTFYFKIPLITRYTLTAIFGMATIATYISYLKFIIYFIFLDYNLALKKFQIWRLFTNVFYIGPFSSQFLFFMVMSYFNLAPLEKEAIATRTYATFIMMIFYLLSFLNIVNFSALKLFGYNSPFTLSFQLLLSLIYIGSKREPQKIVTLYFFRMKNCYLPFALIIMNIISGGGIYDNIVGIIVGNTYYVLEDVLPVNKNIRLLQTPKFLVDFLEKYYYSRHAVVFDNDGGNHRDDNNRRGGGGGGDNGGNYGFGTVLNRGGEYNRRGNNNGGNNRGFTAFGGRGTTIG